MIHVCFITDENYVLPTLVAIKSLIYNSKEKLSINVVSTSLCQKSQQLFLQLETVNAKINIIYTQNPCENIPNSHKYITNTVFIKFILPNIFKDLDKILYLDSDTLILKDLQELYDIDLENNFAGVVQDVYVCKIETHYREAGFKNYFNAGVMLMNLSKMRQEAIVDKLIDYAYNGKYKKYKDQDALNFVFNEKVKWLPIKYNFFNLLYNAEFVTSCLNISNEEYNNIANPITISHYAGVIIDRMAEMAHEKDFRLWYKYFNMLPNSDFKNCKAIELLKQYHKIQNKKILSLIQKIFSIKNNDGHKVVTIMFIKIKFRLKKKQ